MEGIMKRVGALTCAPTMRTIKRNLLAIGKPLESVILIITEITLIGAKTKTQKHNKY